MPGMTLAPMQAAATAPLWRWKKPWTRLKKPDEWG
jgi:hypothetical protein